MNEEGWRYRELNGIRHRVDDYLASWSSVKAKHQWTGLLVGNGASRAVWEPFKYTSLYSEACSEDVAHPLRDDDIAIFHALGTENFERVLAGLVTTGVVCRAAGQDAGFVEEHYESIRRSLIEAVSAVHIPWKRVAPQMLRQIATALRAYRFVYSTNYDLLIYWAIMADQGKDFKDYLWGGRFQPSNTDVWDEKATRVLYLHGALHLYQGPGGHSFKRVSGQFTNLLDLFKLPPTGDAAPLFITEGSADDKLQSIYGSDYLSFVFRQFERHEGPLVVFGHSLSDSDRHLVHAMNEWGNRPIAISLVAGDPVDIVRRKHELHERLPRAQLIFFDAATHPLGLPSLKIASLEADHAMAGAGQ